MEVMESNRQRQKDEITALQAIFGEGAVEIADSNTFILHTPIDSIQAQADIRFHLPSTYPSDDSPIFEWIGARDTGANSTDSVAPGYIYIERNLTLSSDMHTDIEREIHRLWDQDLGRDVVIFSWISWLTEYLEHRWPQPLDPILLPRDNYDGPGAQGCCGSDRCSCKDSHTTNKQPVDTGDDSKAYPAIYTGMPLEMKKSVFLGHVARVKCAKDVRNVLDTLMLDKKIAQATHNISAYRICLDSGSISQDNDDDGEYTAGKRLGHLLHLLGVENIMVVVTRWYGGTQLGPDRFKLINNAARQALESGGFLDNIPRKK